MNKTLVCLLRFVELKAFNQVAHKLCARVPRSDGVEMVVHFDLSFDIRRIRPG